MEKRKYRYIVLFFAVVFPLLLFVGCASADVDSESVRDEIRPSNTLDDTMKTEDIMKIKVSSGNVEVIFELNDSSASRSFYGQLPLIVSVGNYSTNEKVFELPQELDISDVWEGSCPSGSIAYFLPWNNIAMYYGDAPEYKGLYPMGTAVDGAGNIEELTGSITITAYTE